MMARSPRREVDPSELERTLHKAIALVENLSRRVEGLERTNTRLKHEVSVLREQVNRALHK